VEHALDPKYAKVVGVQLDDLLVSQPTAARTRSTSPRRSSAPTPSDVIVIDSVAALISKQELDGQMGDATVGSQARLMSQPCAAHGRDQQDQVHLHFHQSDSRKDRRDVRQPETTPGGRALKFFSSIRIDIRRKDQIKTPEGRWWATAPRSRS